MEYENVKAAKWRDWTVRNAAVILDVREPKEWALGTLPDATLMSMRELPGRLGELPKDSPILVVCRSGARSAHVAAYLSYHGFKAANMTGGLAALGMAT